MKLKILIDINDSINILLKNESITRNAILNSVTTGFSVPNTRTTQ